MIERGSARRASKRGNSRFDQLKQLATRPKEEAALNDTERVLAPLENSYQDL